MEGLVYLSVRVGCAAYLLYKVWEQKKKVRELCDLLYTPAKREQMISMSPESADEKEVMGKTRFVYLDENAGKTAAPYMSQPLEQGTDYIGEDEESGRGCGMSASAGGDGTPSEGAGRTGTAHYRKRK